MMPVTIGVSYIGLPVLWYPSHLDSVAEVHKDTT